jgi:hypothetical protein
MGERFSLRKVGCIALLATILLLLGSDAGVAMGLSVEPGGLLLQRIKPGERYDLEAMGGLRLKISNQSPKQRVYQISVATPVQLGITGWTAGYSPIPDPGWFAVEPAEIEVPPEGENHARMFINIPADPRYYNQHWVVAVAVQEKPGAGEVLALALKPVYYLETESRAETSPRPYGSLGIVPTVLQCSQTVSPGRQPEAPCGELKIYNGDSRPLTLTISAETPSVLAGAHKVDPSPEYSWLAKPESVQLSVNHFILQPKESRAISVRVASAPDAPLLKRECLLWVRSDEGPAGFARLQMR